MAHEFIAKNGIISQGNIVISGSITTTGAITVSGSIASASYSLSASYASSSTSASYAVSSSYAYNSTLYNGTASTVFATTGSNNLTGDQHITSVADASAFAATASLYTDGGLQVTKNAYFSSSMFIKGDLTIYGTQSIAYITSSQLNISTNVITVNTATPSVRFGGLSVYDSGSTGTGATGSLFWDSQNNGWVYQRESGSTYSGGMLISGPRRANGTNLGDEQGLTACMIPVAQGSDHITSSMIYHDGTNTCIPNTLIGSTVCSTMLNASCIGIGITSPNGVLETNGRIVASNGGGASRVALNIESNDVGTAYSAINSYNYGTTAGRPLAINESGGNVMINTTTDSGYKLDVNGTGRFSSNLYTSTALYINTTAAYGFKINSEGSNGFYNRGGSTTAHYPFLLENASGALLFQVQGNGVATFSGQIISTAASDILAATSSGTAYKWINLANTGGNLVVGLNNSAGGATMATSAYASYIFTRTATDLVFGTNEVVRMTLTSGGNVGIGGTPTVYSVSSPTLSLKNSSNDSSIISITKGATQFGAFDGNVIASVGTTNNLAITTDGGYISFSTFINGYTSLSERMRITNTGITCFSCQICVKERVYISGTFPGVMLDRASTTAQSDIQWKDAGTSVWSIGTAVAAVGSNLDFYSYGLGNVLKLAPTGEACFRGVVCASGGVVPGNGASLLSYYSESASFTPCLYFQGAVTGLSYATRSGYYTRIGNIVTAHMYIQWCKASSATDNLGVYLPLNLANNSTPAIGTFYSGNPPSETRAMSLYGSPNGNVGVVLTQGGNGNLANCFANSTLHYWSLSITYLV